MVRDWRDGAERVLASPTALRPSILNNKPGSRTVRVLVDLSSFHRGTIFRTEVASFVFDQAQGDALLLRSPPITWQDK